MKITERDRPAVEDRDVARVQGLVGRRLRRSGLNTLATVQSIRRWALGIGERNPLYLDMEYGRGSRYGTMIAPPLWLHSVDDTVVAPGLPGLHALYVGADWEFFFPVRIGDRVSAGARLISVEERESRFAGRSVRQTGEILYKAPDDRLFARCVSSIDRVSRAEAAARGLYSSVQKYRYTEDELLAIEDAYDAEAIRADRVRYWDDTAPGEQMTPVVKGPLSSEDIITFVCATAPVRTYENQVRYRERHPLSEFYDAETGRYDAWERAFLDPEVAQQFGFPLPHDLGYQRVAWIGSMLTNWAGDDAQLRRLKIDIKRPNFHGDTTFMHGLTGDKLQRDSEAIVRAEVWCENQRGERTAEGFAEIELQARSIPFRSRIGA